MYKDYLVAARPTAICWKSFSVRLDAAESPTQEYLGTEASTSIAILANAVADVEPQVMVEAVSPEAIWLMHIPVPGTE